MSRSLRQYVALSLVTFRELACEPICVLLSIICSLLVGLVPLATFHRFGETGKLARDGALAFHLLIGLAIAVSAASSAIGREFTRGTASALLAKPLNRATFYLSKYTGVALIVLLFSVSITLSTLLAERISEHLVYSEAFRGNSTDTGTLLRLISANLLALIWGAWHHWRHGRFGPAVLFSQPLLLLLATISSGFFTRWGALQPFSLGLDLRIIPASILVTVALLTLATISVAANTRLKNGPTLALSFTVLFLGLLLDAWVPHGGVLPLLLRAIVPNWQHFWQCDALTGGGTIANSQVLNAIYYASTYSAAMLILGVMLLRQRDLN